MPYTKRTGLYYPKKGSDEAYEWSERMNKLRSKRKKYKQNLVVQCAWCKKIMKKGKRDDIEKEQREIRVSHGICSKCSKKLIKK
jgi:hypothetical protein